ncbi:putative Aminoglycoside phosphotransferase domain-containing protein [Seiridium cardinale]|uniref:Aminoglycoside phosphotransferase domain-containing protein n=1 Tax=Seiridium cardinale TaxID=138064 RepID=A0ABR2XMH3_9PEZI
MPERPPLPTHPLDWGRGVDGYLEQNGLSCEKAKSFDSGTSCYIWLLEGVRGLDASTYDQSEGQPVVMKCADSAPKDQSIQVSPERLQFEVQALRCKAIQEACRQEPSVQVPRVLRTTTNGFIMNWVGDQDLRAACKSGNIPDVKAVGDRLGRWLGCLHVSSIALGLDGWVTHRDEIDILTAPGGFAEQTVRDAFNSKEEVQYILAEMRAPAPIHALTHWDFRPMNILVNRPDEESSTLELTVVDWELCHYGDPSNDIRMWVVEVMVLEGKFGDHGLLSSFLSAYKERTGTTLVDEAFVARVALNAGIYLLWILPLNPQLWDCTEQDVEYWKSLSLEFIRAGTRKDMAWLRESRLKPLLLE